MSMQYSRFTPALLVISSLLTAGCLLGSQPVQAQNRPAPGQRGFWCDASTSVPVTMYQSAQGGVEPWIRWTSNTFTEKGYDSVTRCRQVTSRLENYRRNKQLKLITAGIMNGQRVICTASQVNGRCEGLIFTLKPNQDAVRTLNNLLAWREGQASTPSLSESGAIPYIDVSGRLGGGEPTSTSPDSAPSVQPSPSPSGSSGGREL